MIGRTALGGFLWLVGIVALLPTQALAANGTGPVVFWEFGTEEETPLVLHGNVTRDVPGPRPPEFPDFDAGNIAVKMAGDGYFSFADPGERSSLDFTTGDAITLEAWVQVEVMREGENRYLIGKGRTGSPGFAPDNQNWALRLRGNKDQACISFLFATPPAAGVAKSDAHWHRWTSTEGMAPKSGWHHVAVAYRFGEPESICGWIDGQRVKGQWDMGGATAEAPVVDNDALWIGSALGGKAGNSFVGSLDSLGVHRTLLDDKIIGGRFHRVGGPVVAKPAVEAMPELGPLPAGRVVATFHEGLPAHDRWYLEGESTPPVVLQWEGNEFLLPRLPRRYDAWGIRDSWKAPVLVRLAADVILPPGEHEVLLRARGLSRLWIDGQVVARTKPLTGSPSGEEAITPVAEPPVPGARRAEHRLQESRAEVQVGPEGRCRVILEAVAGGKAFRAETGELCVAVRTADGNSFDLLSAASGALSATPSSAAPIPVALTDAAVESALTRIETSLERFDELNRRSARASREAFWQQRHQAARDWVAAHPAPAVPADTATGSAQGSAVHPIDAFLAEKLHQAQAAAAQSSPEEARQFHQTVLPILRNECIRCHGDKSRGGLRLDSRTAVLKGGDSELPAVVPGKAADSELVRRIRSDDEAERMPPNGSGLKEEQILVLEKWIATGAAWPSLPLTPEQTTWAPVIDDAAFLRRLSFDTIGLPPTAAEVAAFLEDRAADKRQQAIDRLLADPRRADHWMSYWQDLLAENPTLINATLNSTGPFRWFLYDALRDDLPLDRLVTELILLRGSQHDGGSAGFGMAAQNDAPLAAKAHVVASAFLGIELQCARCHDSPYHSTKQRDLYALSAMFSRQSVAVPKTSSVPAAFFEKKARQSLIQVTLKPGEPIAPVWPFAAATGAQDDDTLGSLMDDPRDTRERLATLITAPQNTRFAEVMVNRIWRRLLGAGMVEPAHDWEGRTASHPELLQWLARELVSHDYSVRHVERLILSSDAYQRQPVGHNLEAAAEVRFFNATERRRLSAEQLVDGFFAAAGKDMDVERLTLDPDGRRPASNRQMFGQAHRAWMLVSLSNERDRPSLTLPRAAVVCDVLDTFGWSAARQTPRTDRETAPNVLQPGAMANSTLTLWLTRASAGSQLAELAVDAADAPSLVDSLFLRFLNRRPTPPERKLLVAELSPDFDRRLVPPDQIAAQEPWPLLPQVTWSNHLRSEANTIQQEWERRMRTGPPSDPRLQSAWRERYEDAVWSLVNLREFVWLP